MRRQPAVSWPALPMIAVRYTYSPRQAARRRAQRLSDRRAAIASVSCRSWAAAASLETCAARSSAVRLSFAGRKTWATWMA